MAKHMNKKESKRKNTKIKKEHSEDNDEFIKFLSSSNKIITCLRLIKAKISQDAQKGALLLKKTELNESEKSSTASLPLSFVREINSNNKNLLYEDNKDNNDDNNNDDNNDNNNNEHKYSELNKNIFNFDAGFHNSIFSQNNSIELENEKFFDGNNEEKNDILFFN